MHREITTLWGERKVILRETPGTVSRLAGSVGWACSCSFHSLTIFADRPKMGVPSLIAARPCSGPTRQ